MKQKLAVLTVVAAAAAAGSAAAAPPKTLPQSPCGTSGGFKVYALRVPCNTAKEIVKDAAASAKQSLNGGQLGRSSSHGLKCVYTGKGGKAAIQCADAAAKKLVLGVKV